MNFKGCTKCAAGMACKFLNDFYSQCTPADPNVAPSTALNAAANTAVDAAANTAVDAAANTAVDAAADQATSDTTPALSPPAVHPAPNPTKPIEAPTSTPAVTPRTVAPVSGDQGTGAAETAAATVTQTARVEPSPDNLKPLPGNLGVTITLIGPPIAAATVPGDSSVGVQLPSSPADVAAIQSNPPKVMDGEDDGEVPLLSPSPIRRKHRRCAQGQRLKELQQCGGRGYHGCNKCGKGLKCFKQNKHLSQCRTACPPGWEC